MIDIIRNDLEPARLSQIAINTLAVMEEHKVFEVPVLDNQNKLLGLIDEPTIMKMENLNSVIHLVKTKLKNIFISKNTHLFQIIKIFSEHKLSLIPVVNNNNFYLGYIRPFDIISKINTPRANITGITISLHSKDYTLQEISRLIEENNAKIISLLSEIKTEKIQLHLLLSCDNSDKIIQTLERYDYKIMKTFSTNFKNDDFADRFESFMKYLNP